MREGISTILKNKRKELGLTVKELEKKSGVTFVEINNIELCKNKPTAKTLLKLADALHLDFDDLFFRDL